MSSGLFYDDEGRDITMDVLGADDTDDALCPCGRPAQHAGPHLWDLDGRCD